MDAVKLQDYDLAEVGDEHDFSVVKRGVVIANVWHSDKGEWTIETPDGPVYRRGSRSDALELIVAHLLAL